MNRTVPLAIALLSAALLAFQIILLQAFSSAQWYHFAYMVISVALLGFGASGTALTIAHRWFLRHHVAVMIGAALVSAASMPVCLALSQFPPARFDSYLLLTEPEQVGALFLSYLLLTIPFFTGAIVIGLAFVRYTEHMGSLYFANLVGSGSGGLLGLGLLYFGTPTVLSAMTGLLAAAAAACLLLSHRSRRLVAGWVGVTAVIGAFFLLGPPLHPSQYKDVERARLMPGVETVATERHPMGTVEVLRSDLFREAPGLSLAYRGEIPARDLVFINGDLSRSLGGSEHVRLRDFTTAGLPFQVANPETVLILGGMRPDAVGQALAHGARHVTVNEPHGGVRRILARGEIASIVRDPRVEIHPGEARALLAEHTSRFDLIVMPDIGSFGGTSGLTALHEQYDLTLESLGLMWRRLTDNGAITATAWVDYPARNPLRLLASMTEMLERNGIHSVEEHLIAVRSWGSVTFVAQKRPAGAMADSVRSWSHRLLFDPLVLPAVRPAERSRYNALQDTSLLQAVDSLLTGDRASLYGAYPFRIYPTTDDRPYFSQFLKWRYLPALRAQFGQGRIPFLELGTITVALTWLQIAVIAVVLILLPLVRLVRSSSGRARTLSYFGSLAVGFMFVELIMIQRFTLYLGHPVRAVAFVFAVLLICSGLGSIASARLHPRARDLHAIAGRVVIGLIALVIFLKPLLDLTIGLPMPVRLVAGTAVLGPVAFLMGFPFPLGLRVLDSTSKSLVPWAWAVNGCLSVASAPAAVLLAAEGGATVVLAAAAAFYGIAAMTGRFAQQAPG